MKNHSTKCVAIVTITDPDTGNPVEIEIRKNQVTGLMVGLDETILKDLDAPIYDPYNKHEMLDIPDNETEKPVRFDLTQSTPK